MTNLFHINFALKLIPPCIPKNTPFKAQGHHSLVDRLTIIVRPRFHTIFFNGMSSLPIDNLLNNIYIFFNPENYRFSPKTFFLINMMPNGGWASGALYDFVEL